MPEPHGRQIAHSRHVVRQDVRACFSSDRTFRFKLDIPYRRENGRNQTVAVVMKNLSSADECNADTTIRRVEEYVHRNFRLAAALTVLNLLAYRATDPGTSKERGASAALTASSRTATTPPSPLSLTRATT